MGVQSVTRTWAAASVATHFELTVTPFDEAASRVRVELVAEFPAHDGEPGSVTATAIVDRL